MQPSLASASRQFYTYFWCRPKNSLTQQHQARCYEEIVKCCSKWHHFKRASMQLSLVSASRQFYTYFWCRPKTSLTQQSQECRYTRNIVQGCTISKQLRCNPALTVQYLFLLHTKYLINLTTSRILLCRDMVRLGLQKGTINAVFFYLFNFKLKLLTKPFHILLFLHSLFEFE